MQTERDAGSSSSSRALCAKIRAVFATRNTVVCAYAGNFGKFHSFHPADAAHCRCAAKLRINRRLHTALWHNNSVA